MFKNEILLLFPFLKPLIIRLEEFELELSLLFWVIILKLQVSN